MLKIYAKIIISANYWCWNSAKGKLGRVTWRQSSLFSCRNERQCFCWHFTVVKQWYIFSLVIIIKNCCHLYCLFNIKYNKLWIWLLVAFLKIYNSHINKKKGHNDCHLCFIQHLLFIRRPGLGLWAKAAVKCENFSCS